MSPNVSYRRQKKARTATHPVSKQDKTVVRVILCVAAVILLGVAVLMLTGNITLQYGQEEFTVKATYWGGTTVRYEDVDDIAYVEQDEPGYRTMGFGSARLLMGSFQNEAYGNYTRYSYTRCPSGVVLTVGEKTLVLSGKNEEETRKIYAELTARLP